MLTITLPALNLALIPDPEAINSQILKQFWLLYEQGSTRQSHFFHGRFENIYIDLERIPALLPIVAQVKSTAATILKCEISDLKYGFWFNLMRPGDQTSLHNHEEDDELLSAVYYITTPQGSGDLILGKPPLALRLQPYAGLVAYFPPQLPHAVDTNNSNHDRLAIAFNFGLNTN